MIIGIVGSMGGGKTILMTSFAHKYFKNGSDVYANYGLRFKFNPLRMSDISNCDHDFNNALLAIDEIHLFMDSRQSMTKNSRIISYFITQSRKRNLVLIYTTQQSGQVDKRLRANTDYFIKCENLSPKDAKKDIFIRWTINDMIGHQKVFIMKADPYFELYDTHQVIDFTK